MTSKRSHVFLPKSNAIINSFLTLMISLHMSSQQQQREEWLERVESRRLRSAPGLSGNSNICTSHAQNRNGWIDRFNDISLHRKGMRNNSYLEDDACCMVYRVYRNQVENFCEVLHRMTHGRVAGRVIYVYRTCTL